MSEAFNVSHADFLSARYLDTVGNRCLCDGAYHSGGHTRHVVWLAFGTNDAPSLCYEGCCMMRAASFVFNTNVGHCQFVFYDNAQQQFYTYSADVKNGVSVAYTKTFAKEGWRFIQIEVSEEQELAIRKTLIEQVGKPFDTWAVVWLKFWPRKTTRSAWFCSELMMTALQSSGLAPEGPIPYTTPPHRLYHYLKTEKIGAYCEELTYVDADGVRRFTNPVVISNGFRSGNSMFKY